MNKLSMWFKGLVEKWNNLTKNKKIAYGIIVAGLIAAIIFGGVSLFGTKYEVLFSNMDPTDSAAVYTKLQEQKVSAKVQGNSILVPKGQVDQLRMEMLSSVQMTNGSQGFELLDKSKFGATDTETKINYQRALQGELERTIKGFPEIEGARVHLVLPEDTTFVKDTSPATASVTVKVKAGKKLSPDQVKAIVSLVSGAVKDLPKENIDVVDDKLTLLTKDLDWGDGQSAGGITSAEKQQDLTSSYEKKLETKLLSMLEAIYGKDKVKVKINADLDFDAVQQDSTTYDPNSVVVSEHTITDGTGTGTTTNGSNSPVDNNASNTIVNNNTGTGNNVHQDVTKNYDVSKVDQKTIKAPGAVKRLTTSVAIDGNIDDATKNSIRNLAVTAIGFSDTRGDSITVEGIQFDTTEKDAIKKDIDAIQQAQDKSQKIKLYSMIGGAAAALILIVTAFIMIRRRKADEELEDQVEHRGIDVIIGDGDLTKEMPSFKPLELDVENEKSHFENEIKRYAKDKPDQVADIIKSWLAEDER